MYPKSPAPPDHAGTAERPRRPESVLIVIYTAGGEFLLIERCKPAGFWQSVTGSLEWGELPAEAAPREVLEETGIATGELTDLHLAQTYEIWPSFGRVYAPGVTHNVEHAFALKLPHRVPITLSPREHAQYRWLTGQDALATVSSQTNRAIIERLLLDA